MDYIAHSAHSGHPQGEPPEDDLELLLLVCVITITAWMFLVGFTVALAAGAVQ